MSDVFTEIYVVDDGGGSYEWSQTHIYRRTVDGALASYHDSGCSCNWYETPHQDTLEWRHSVTELITDFRGDLDDMHWLTPVERAEHVIKLKELLRTEGGSSDTSYV